MVRPSGEIAPWGEWWRKWAPRLSGPRGFPAEAARAQRTRMGGGGTSAFPPEQAAKRSDRPASMGSSGVWQRAVMLALKGLKFRTLCERVRWDTVSHHHGRIFGVLSSHRVHSRES